MRKASLLCVFICFACFFGLASAAGAVTRTALVIGNGNYKGATALQNPVNDALDMAEALRDLGFEVICKVDAGREEMDAAVQDFFRKLNRAQAGFFYYAGHGMQIDGINYLLPVDIRVSSSGDVKHRAIKMDWILSKMEDSGSDVNIVVLDACRDNPFRGFRGTGNGLAPIQGVRGSFIAYATSPGSVARDGRGRNGLYTSHLLRNIKKPGLTVEEVFREVRKQVAAETNDKQIPWDSSSLMGEFFIAGGGAGDSAERMRFQEEQARIEKERRELEELRAEIERKQRESQQQRIEVASVPQRPPSSRHSSSSSSIVDRDGAYVAYANGIVKDTSTGLEWKAGPDTYMTWDEARSWVQSLGGDWRMPTTDELAGLYNKGKGDRNMTPLLKTTGWWVWSGETKGSSIACYFYFSAGFAGWDGRNSSRNIRAFAVRSQIGEDTTIRRKSNSALDTRGVIATGSRHGSYSGYSANPKQAIDGKISSWHNMQYSPDDPPKSHRENFWGPISIPAWLQLEFPAKHWVDEIVIYFSQHALTMDIQASLDGSNWFEIVPKTQVNPKRYGDAPASRHSRQRFDVPPNTQFKYLKLRITQTDAPSSHIYKADIDEIIVIGNE